LEKISTVITLGGGNAILVKPTNLEQLDDIIMKNSNVKLIEPENANHSPQELEIISRAGSK